MNKKLESTIAGSLGMAKNKQHQERLRSYWWGYITHQLDTNIITMQEYVHLRDVVTSRRFEDANGVRHTPPEELI